MGSWYKRNKPAEACTFTGRLIIKMVEQGMVSIAALIKKIKYLDQAATCLEKVFLLQILGSAASMVCLHQLRSKSPPSVLLTALDGWWSATNAEGCVKKIHETAGTEP